MFQVRRKEPRAGRRDPYYCPERDIAHLGPELVRRAMYAVDDQLQEPWFQQWMAQENVTVETIGQAAMKLAKAMGKVTHDLTIAQALKDSGFSSMPPAAQAALYIKLGQVLLSGIWAGVKDITAPEGSPPPTVDELADDAQDVLRQLHCVDLAYGPTTEEFTYTFEREPFPYPAEKPAAGPAAEEASPHE